MYAILLIERLLIEPQFHDIYSKANSSIDTKTSAKLVRSIEISTNRLGLTFRSLLGWSAWFDFDQFPNTYNFIKIGKILFYISI